MRKLMNNLTRSKVVNSLFAVSFVIITMGSLSAVTLAQQSSSATLESVTTTWCSAAPEEVGLFGWDLIPPDLHYQMFFDASSNLGHTTYYVYYNDEYVGPDVANLEGFNTNRKQWQFGIDTSWAWQHSGWNNRNSWRVDYDCTEPPTPPPTPTSAPPPLTDNATFTDNEIPDDRYVASPGETIHKTWWVQNSGSTTWGDGYQLVFLSGDQMGAPGAVSVPAAAPGDIVGLEVDIVAPSEGGEYRGDWKLRNSQGTFFGDRLWVQFTVPGGSPPSGEDIELTCLDCPATVVPGQTFRPTIRALVNEGQLQGVDLRGDMLRHKSGERYGAHELIAVEGSVVVNPGQTYDFIFYENDPLSAPYEEGVYETTWQVWRDGHWDGEEITIRFEVSSSGGNNYPPNRPTLTGPGDWAVYQGEQVVLTAQHNGDPDGDAVNEYYFDLRGTTPRNSGWIASNTWSPTDLPYNGYEWQVKVRDEHGNESDWSEQTWHFNVLNNDPEIYDFHSETCREAWGGSEKLCFCAQTNAGTLKLMVNMASDGSDSGEWRVLNELGVPNYECANDDDRPPNWGQLEGETGCHLVRLYARRDGGWENAAHQDIQVCLPAERRPNTPPMQYPLNASHVSSLDIYFDWQETLRTANYNLEMSTEPDFSVLLVDETFTDITEYDYTFSTDYSTVYWRVTSTGPYGSNKDTKSFHIDLDPPTSAVTALPPVTTDTKFSVNWSGSDERSGLRWYHVQVREGNRPDSEWADWLANTPKTVEMFQAQPGHTFYVRVRAMDNIGNWEDWPTNDDGDTYTLVDPSAAPATSWWDEDYAWKRNLIILNNDSDALPVHYPMHIHFDDTTDPTAAEIYDASLSVTKGDDARIVYQDQTELNRFVQRFTSSQIDLWFPLQAGLGGGQTDSGSYQIYYGSAGASSPPADINNIFVPEVDANTIGLWRFQEGSGSTLYDMSGQGHDCTFSNGGWADGYLGYTGVFNGINTVATCGNHADWDRGAMTIEAWIYLNDADQAAYARVVDRDRYYLGLTSNRQLKFKAFKQETNCYAALEMNQWYHVAGTYDGNNRVRVYVNGVQSGEHIGDGSQSNADVPLLIGAETGSTERNFPGFIQHVRISNIERTDFSYGKVDVAPSVAVGVLIAPPTGGAADLAVLGLTTYPNPDGGLLVQAIVQNKGDVQTLNNFYTDLYIDHLPTGGGDYTGSLRFWVNSSIQASATVTLTTVITELAGLGVLAPGDEVTGTLYGQVDSTGVISEADNANNIYSTGIEICLTSPDAHEGDDTFETAPLIALGETQSHNFDSLADQDWVRIEAQGDVTYTLCTSDLDSGADTYLYLYDTDGATLLAANDDYDGSLASQIDWQATSTGTYYLLVQHWNPNVGGCKTGYTLSFSEKEEEQAGFTIYLPVVMRN